MTNFYPKFLRLRYNKAVFFSLSIICNRKVKNVLVYINGGISNKIILRIHGQENHFIFIYMYIYIEREREKKEEEREIGDVWIVL